MLIAGWENILLLGIICTSGESARLDCLNAIRQSSTTSSGSRRRTSGLVKTQATQKSPTSFDGRQPTNARDWVLKRCEKERNAVEAPIKRLERTTEKRGRSTSGR